MLTGFEMKAFEVEFLKIAERITIGGRLKFLEVIGNTTLNFLYFCISVRSFGLVVRWFEFFHFSWTAGCLEL